MPALSEDQYGAPTKSSESIHLPEEHVEQKGSRTSSYGTEVEFDPISRHVSEVGYEVSGKIPPTQCLFCNIDSPTLNENVNHMASQHGLFIPSPDQLSDLESFVGYLATIIFKYKECLYCGIEKGTVDGAQTHMRDKGHCMIMMNTGSELFDFWEPSNGEDEGQYKEEECTKSAVIKLSQTEMRLPSGVVINARSDTTKLRAKPGLAHPRIKGSQHRTKRAKTRAIAAEENQEMTAEGKSGPSYGNDRRVVVRGEMGLAGISQSQRRALQITEIKMRKREAVAKAANRHAMEQEPNKTKYYKVRHFEQQGGKAQCPLLMHVQTEAPIYQAG